MTRKKEFNLDVIAPHTVKKFELISAYVSSWAEKLLNYSKCDGIVYIDCMSNAGEYIVKKTSNIIQGTSLLVVSILLNCARKYRNKTIKIYFNDFDKNKIEHLENRINELYPKKPSNLLIQYSIKDASIFLKELKRNRTNNLNTLLIYDPYKADIDWLALDPYLNTWGEVIINHVIHDSVRGIKQTKDPEKISRYERTYEKSIDDLVNMDKKEYQEHVDKIIRRHIHPSLNAFLAYSVFYISTNVQVYNLIHVTHNEKGFLLFKNIAWKIAGGQAFVQENWLDKNQPKLFGYEPEHYSNYNINYSVYDIADYIVAKFSDRGVISFNDIFDDLKHHPIFPNDGFRREIKKALKEYHNCTITKTMLYFP